MIAPSVAIPGRAIKAVLYQPCIAITDAVTEPAPFLVAVIRFVVEKPSQSGVNAYAADFLHVLVARYITVSVYPDRTNQ